MTELAIYLCFSFIVCVVFFYSSQESCLQVSFFYKFCIYVYIYARIGLYVVVWRKNSQVSLCFYYTHMVSKKKSVSRSLNLQVILGFLRLHLKSGLSTELKVFDLQLRSEHMLVCKQYVLQALMKIQMLEVHCHVSAHISGCNFKAMI